MPPRARAVRLQVAPLRAVAALLGIGVLLGLAGTALADPVRWAPTQKLTWYWQLSGSVNNVYPAAAYDIDGFDNSAAEVATLHSLGKRVICYVDVGTWEPGRPDSGEFPAGLKGNSVSGWPGEYWLDVRPSGPYYSTLQSIMAARLQMCAGKGFDAVEPDNMDSWDGNNAGFPTTAADQATYNDWVASTVHADGMAVFQKNDPNQVGTLEPYFDGALSEQCSQYSECSAFQPYLANGKPVLDAEYQSSLYPAFCVNDGAAGIMGALYSLALDGSTYQPCWPASFNSIGPGGTIGGGGPGGLGGAGAPGTGPGAAGASQAGHARAPQVGLGSGRLTARHGRVLIRITCPAGQAYCDGTVELEAGARHGILGKARFHILGGRQQTVSLRLTPRVLAHLARRRAMTVTLTAVTSNQSGLVARSGRTTNLAFR